MIYFLLLMNNEKGGILYKKVTLSSHTHTRILQDMWSQFFYLLEIHLRPFNSRGGSRGEF